MCFRWVRRITLILLGARRVLGAFGDICEVKTRHVSVANAALGLGPSIHTHVTGHERLRPGSLLRWWGQNAFHRSYSHFICQKFTRHGQKVRLIDPRLGYVS